MTSHEMERLLDEAEQIFAAEAKLIRLESGRCVIAGDTHGDLEATERVIHKYLKPGSKLVFLGDYVDRGPSSLQNINYLLRQKAEQPDSLYLLMGNHEGHAVSSFQPADFWEGLDVGLRQRYGEVLCRLPLAVSSSNGIIALHGALPGVPALEDINSIEPGSTEWQQVTWGDWYQTAGGFLGIDPSTGRLQFGKDWFDQLMARFTKNVLIRSHQPDVPPVMYGGRCLTIFTSSVYRNHESQPAVALVDLASEVRSADDIMIESI
jgi:hypothetical protein